MIDFIFINSPAIVFFICIILYFIFYNLIDKYSSGDSSGNFFYFTIIFSFVVMFLCIAAEKKIKTPYLNKTHTVEVKKKTVISCISYYEGIHRAYPETNEMVVNGNALYLLERKSIDFYYKDGNIVRFDTKNCTGQVEIEKAYKKNQSQ